MVLHIHTIECVWKTPLHKIRSHFMPATVAIHAIYQRVQYVTYYYVAISCSYEIFISQTYVLWDVVELLTCHVQLFNFTSSDLHIFLGPSYSNNLVTLSSSICSLSID